MNIEGTVFVNFVIEKDGTPTSFTITRGVEGGIGLDREALNACMKLGKFNPGTQNGHILSAAGYGMPKMADNRFKGRLLMPIKIIVPTKLTDHQKQLLKDNFS